MKRNNILVIDYGLGNLYSVTRALEMCGANNVFVSSSQEDISSADKIILPGVGAFADGIRGLNDRGCIDPLIKHVSIGKPLLGICLGMQMLANVSEEFGLHKGLGLIPGRVRKINNKNIEGMPRKNPFIGWASLSRPIHADWSNSIMQKVNTKDEVYFVHSFQFEPDVSSDLLATYNNSGDLITAAVKRANVTGLQFHPEKSGNVGLRILKEFVENNS
jgi:glutamine amidotransferase